MAQLEAVQKEVWIQPASIVFAPEDLCLLLERQDALGRCAIIGPPTSDVFFRPEEFMLFQVYAQLWFPARGRQRLRQKDHEAGATERPLADEQKRAIADLRKFYDAKLAEREILHQDALKKAQNYDEVAKLTDELTQDRDRLARERDRKIAEIRAADS